MTFIQISSYCFISLLFLLFQVGLCNSDVENNQELLNRVLGGESAENFVVRRMASIWRTSENSKRIFRCSGSILGEKWILTVAHCFFPEGTDGPTAIEPVNEAFAIVAEARFTASTSDSDSGPYFFESVFVHKDYVPRSSNTANDIAIAKLNRTIPISRFSPVRISSLSNKKRLRKRKVSAAGYGSIDSQGTSPDVVMATELMIESFSTCGGGGFLEDDKIVCAVSIGFPDVGITDTCFGDSGGPLFIGDRGTDSFLQIGITSSGPETCAKPGSNGWYTRVSYYYNQIQEALDGDSASWTVFD